MKKLGEGKFGTAHKAMMRGGKYVVLKVPKSTGGLSDGTWNELKVNSESLNSESLKIKTKILLLPTGYGGIEQAQEPS